MKFRFFICIAAMMASLTGSRADACSRILYVGEDSLRIVGRSLDWKTPIPTNLYVYPRGMAKVGNVGDNVVKWTSRYGSVYAVGYDGGVTEGMNEMGLVINGLFCKGTVYNNDSTAGRPGMSLAVFVAWLLDMNATTPEVVKVLKEHNFDKWGAPDSGTIKVYEGEDMKAMTNDPSYPEMQAINDYWIKVGGENMLPGTVKSPDRFVRGYFFDGHVEKTADSDLGLAIIRSILVNVSVPYTYRLEGEPNVSSTQWRSFANLRDRPYYFDIVTNPGIYYIDLKKCDLRPGAPVMKLDTSKSSVMIGDVTDSLKPADPFKPMYCLPAEGNPIPPGLGKSGRNIFIAHV